MTLRRFAAAAILAGSVLALVPAASAQDDKTLSVAAVQQLALADNLIAIGTARKDPLLLIAAVRVRTGLTPDAAPLSEKAETNEEVLAKAAEFSAGREDVVALIEDIKAEGSRGDYYTGGGSYCYTAGSATICN